MEWFLLWLFAANQSSCNKTSSSPERKLTLDEELEKLGKDLDRVENSLLFRMFK